MATYYSTTAPIGGATVIIRMDGGTMTSFTDNPENADWRAYEDWLAEGNTPEPWPPAE